MPHIVPASVEVANSGETAIATVRAGAFDAIVAGFALAQRPYMLPPELTVQEAAAPDATLGALLGCVAVGMVVLVPALVWLFRLHLSARLDTGSNV